MVRSFWGLLHRTVIYDLAFAALNKTLCLRVKMREWAGNGLGRAQRTDLGFAEGTADVLFEFCASLVIEKRHYYIIIAFVDKIELAFEGNPIMVRSQSAVRSVRHAVLDLPVGIEVSDDARPSPGLVV
jgi:hypothetical protein